MTWMPSSEPSVSRLPPDVPANANKIRVAAYMRVTNSEHNHTVPYDASGVARGSERGLVETGK